MDKEIDVKLFVTCRLCIEEVGQYQIVPNVQEQFKYCFDINVDPFDGLPQLICQKCKDILNQFFKLKKVYCEKQTELISKYKKGIRIECTPQNDFVTSSSTMINSNQPTENIENKNKSPKKPDRSQLSSETNDFVRHNKKKKTKTAVKKPMTWNYNGFKKEYVCIICNSTWPSQVSVRKHQITHNKFLGQHSTIFQKNLSIMLEKIDGKPNITGMTSIVVHNSKSIIEPCNSLYYIKYSKEKNKKCDRKKSKNVSEISSMSDIVLDNSDTEEEDESIGIPKHRKRRRVLSRSSTDTLVLESNRDISDNEDYKQVTDVQHSRVTDVQCINIADSSDSDVDRHRIDSTHKAKQPVEADEDDHKVIKGIIAKAKANRKSDSTEKSNINIESQLKHKVLSLGRKIINNRLSFNSTGLLTYLAHRNLSVIWVAKAISSNSGKDSDYIRIMTKLRGADASGDNHGWRPVPVLNKVLVESDRASVSNQVRNSPISDIVNNVQPDPDSAVLVICNQTDHKSKLLNANPVANPKQLPKKSTQSSEARFNTPTIELGGPFHNNEDSNLCLPIITSTTSLAIPNVTEQHQNDDPGLVPTLTPGKQTDPPRIKVKPYSQLMSENALNNLRLDALPINMLQNPPDNPMNMLQNNITNCTTVLNPIQNNSNMQWPSQDPSNTILPIILPQVSVSQPMQILPFIPLTSYTPNANVRNKEEYGMMDSVDLPNTRTNSPFNYLKQMFLMHNLVLIEPQTNLARNYLCLIKFKVKFQQECVLDPLILCLSLYCYRNTFCFTVKDRNDVNLNIRELSANWQWEIINVFRGDLVEKLLHNAQKHSQETFDFTNKFICLLKSVTFKKLP